MAKKGDAKKRKYVGKERYREQAQNRKQGGRTAVLRPDNIEEMEIEACVQKLNFVMYEVTEPGHPLAKPGEWAAYRNYLVHKKVGGPTGPSRVCLKSWGEKCPICEDRAGLDWKKDKALMQLLKPQHKIMANLAEEGDNEVEFLDFSFANFMGVIEKEIEGVRNNEGQEAAEEAESFLLPEDGKYVEVRWIKDTFDGNKYFKVDKVNFGDRKEDISDDMMDETVNLDKLLLRMTYDELFREHNGLEGDDGPDTEETDSGTDDDPGNEIPEGMKECIACSGSGKNSRGKRCKPCKGDGYLPIKKDDEEDDGDKDEHKLSAKEQKKADRKAKKAAAEEAEKAAAEKETKKGKGKKKDDDDQCPHGYTFGDSCDKEDECENCEVWEDCVDAQPE